MNYEILPHTCDLLIRVDSDEQRELERARKSEEDFYSDAFMFDYELREVCAECGTDEVPAEGDFGPAGVCDDCFYGR